MRPPWLSSQPITSLQIERPFRKQLPLLQTRPTRQASLSPSASNRHGRVPDSGTLSTANQCVCASVLTTKQFIASCAFVKNQILIWQSRFCAGETSGGTPECSYGPCLRCFANLTVTRQSWLISFHNCARREISKQHYASASPNCRASRSITRSWKKPIAFLS